MSAIAVAGGGCRLTLYVQPRASRTEVVGLHGDALKIRVAAPPVDGAANDALVAFLSKKLGVPRTNILLEAGRSSRRKVFLVGECPAARADAALLPPSE